MGLQRLAVVGQSIAHYHVQAKIGMGGMGEVYRATDSRLDRDVALKLLPEKFARDTERMARFEREAKVLASLNHPNIASIYGLEESNGACALVMELVEGVTLAERIKGGPLPLDEALPIAKQIAEGLEYAHERGIIHRDLKPSNVQVRPDGQVKILDFGLAKAFEGETSEEEIENSPTISAVATRMGVLLGTAAYMSPEQARGKCVDRRADIWAFGCVLYEMLTGREAFAGETTSDTLACVIRAEPDWSSIPTSVPPRICELLRRSLQKDPKQRLRDIGDARITIEEALSGAAQESEVLQVGTVHLPAWRSLLPWAAGILLAALASAGVWELRPRGPVGQIVHFSFAPPPGDSLQFRFGSTPLAISRDGMEIVFLAQHLGTQRLYIRRMDRLESEPFVGTDNADMPFFSPDGKWVGFFADGKLKKVSVLGGNPVTLCDAPLGGGGTWAPDDSIIFAPNPTSGLMRISSAGGTPQPFTRLDSSKGEKAHQWPQVLPGAKTVLYSSGSTDRLKWDWQIAAASLTTGEVKSLRIHGRYRYYVPGDYLTFERPEGLFAVPFDLRTLEVTGSPFPVLQHQGLAISETGSLVYVPRGATLGNLAWVDRKGVVVSIGAPVKDYQTRVSLSPDGKHVVLVIVTEGSYDVWTYDIPHGSLTRFTFEDDNVSPTMSPDGQRIAFSKYKTETISIMAKTVDGSGSEETLLSAQRSTGVVHLLPASWSPDGRFLAYMQIGRSGKREIWVLPLEGERKPQLVLANQFDNAAPKFSPDGRFLAYMSNENGRNEVYVIPFRNGSGKWQISTNGTRGGSVWQRDGKQLFYCENGKIMGVDVTTQPRFTASTPRVIIRANVVGNSGGLDAGFDVSPNGQRFLVHQQNSEAAQTGQINVVLNWSEELRRRSASGKD
jgi:Tol biopolymer transport system component/tRNA A-37 threonylcarbamoyl transferase component Bud32